MQRLTRLRRVRRPTRILIGAVVVAAVLMNGLAYFHARAMTSFAPPGDRTDSPERLSWAGKVRVLATGVRLPRPVSDRTPRDFGIEYETHKLRQPGAPTLEVWRIRGSTSKPVVVMFHGYGACKAELLAEALAFREFGCEVLLVDFRGSGGSDGRDTTLGVHEAGDVARAADFARTLVPGRAVVLYGKSMGSAAILRAMAIGAAHPDGIIVECPFDCLLSTIKNRFAAMNLPAFPMAHLLVFWGGVQHDMNGFDHNPCEYAASVTCPVLMLHGEKDVRVKIPEIRAIYDRLSGSKKLVLFSDAGHESYLAVDAEKWREAVREYLDGLVVGS